MHSISSKVCLLCCLFFFGHAASGLRAVEIPASTLEGKAQDWHEGIAHFASINGEVFINDAQAENKQTFEPANKTIRTAETGRTTLVFSNGLTVLLLGNTELHVEQFKQEPFESSREDVVREPSRSMLIMHLNAGVIITRHRENKATSELRIHTPYGMFESYSQAFMLHVEADKLRCVSASKHLAFYSEKLLTKEFIQEGQFFAYQSVLDKAQAEQNAVSNEEAQELLPYFAEVEYGSSRVFFETQGTGHNWTLIARIVMPKAHLLKAPASGYRSQGL